MAHYDFCTPLSNPSFRIEGLPTGYRYVISKEGSCYRLKIFTHPLSYGRFDMTLVVRSGGSEERADFSVLVRKATTSAASAPSPAPSSTPTSSIETTQENPQRSEWTGQLPTSSTTALTLTPAVTTVTVVEESSPEYMIALGGLAGMLAILTILLLAVRRR